MNSDTRDVYPIPSVRRVIGGIALQGGVFIVVSFLGMGIWLTGWSLSGNPQGALDGLVLFNGLLIAVAAWVSVALPLRFLIHWPWNRLGWPGWRGLDARFFTGVMVGVLAWLGIVALLWMGGRVRWTPVEFRGGRWLAEGVSLLLGAWGEEVVFRGFWFSLLAVRFSAPWAVLVSSLAFALLHSSNPAWSLSASIGVFLAGIVLALARHRTRGLAWPIGFHWAWNVMQGLVLGLPVSGMPLHAPWQATAHGPVWWTGGAFGPEAGLAAWLVLGLLGLGWLHRKPIPQTKEAL